MSEPRRVSAAGGSFTKPSRRLCKARSESLASLSRTFVRRPDAAARRIRPRGHYTNKKQAKKFPIASSEKQRLRGHPPLGMEPNSRVPSPPGGGPRTDHRANRGEAKSLKEQ